MDRPKAAKRQKGFGFMLLYYNITLKSSVRFSETGGG